MAGGGRICGKCGAMNNSTDSYCYNCGSVLASDSQPVPSGIRTVLQKADRGMMIAVMVFFVIAMVFVVAILVFSLLSPDESQENVWESGTYQDESSGVVFLRVYLNSSGSSSYAPYNVYVNGVEFERGCTFTSGINNTHTLNVGWDPSKSSVKLDVKIVSTYNRAASKVITLNDGGYQSVELIFPT